tara:strand:- start:2088 stop:5066 length:2979 start_codon:yes stop_codon:yes gene_type:complete
MSEKKVSDYYARSIPITRRDSSTKPSIPVQESSTPQDTTAPQGGMSSVTTEVPASFPRDAVDNYVEQSPSDTQSSATDIMAPEAAPQSGEQPESKVKPKKKKKTAPKKIKTKPKAGGNDKAKAGAKGGTEQGKVVKKAAEAKKKAVKDQLNVDFDDQTFLWDHIDLVENRKSMDSLGESERKIIEAQERHGNSALKSALLHKKLYKNFLQITDDEPLTTKNKLFGEGIDAINDATTAQLSSIIPYIRLFIVKPATVDSFGGRGQKRGKMVKVEFPFNKFTTLDSILDSRENRGTDVGIKKAQWVDQSSNPGDQGLSFKGSMTLHFQSFEAIFKERLVDNEKIRFADLLMQRSFTQKEAQRDKPTAATDSSNSTNNNNKVVDEIQMECGYTLPPDKIEGDPNLAQKLESMRRFYTIKPLSQDIQITSNGAVDLTFDFAAAVEGRGFGQSTDLLNISDVNLELSDLSQVNKTKDRISEIKKKQAKLNDLTSKLPGKKKRTTDQKNEFENLKNQYKQLKDELKIADGNLRNIQYRRLLNVIRDTVSGADGSRGSIRYLDLNEARMGRYKQFLQERANAIELGKSGDKPGGPLDINESVRALSYAKTEYEADTSEFGEMTISQGASGGAATALGKVSEVMGPMQPGKERGKVAEKGNDYFGGIYRLQYIFLGDIVEAVMKIVYEQPKIRENKVVGKENLDKEIQNQVRVLLGSFSYMDQVSGKVRNIDLADVPVSFNYFNAWWYDNVISANKTVYPLQTFLKDIATKLLNNVLSPKRYGPDFGRRLQVNITSVMLPNNHQLTREWRENKGRIKERISIPKVFQRRRSRRGGSNWSQWLYMSVGGGNTQKAKLRGNLEEDENRNIPHLFLGADTGVIKDIKFSKMKFKGLQRSVLERNYKKGNPHDSLFFSDIYNTDIQLLGNPVFNQNMMIYVDPRAMGLGITDIDPRPFMAELGIGGYYRITKITHNFEPTAFTTTLVGILHRSLRDVVKGDATE